MLVMFDIEYGRYTLMLVCAITGAFLWWLAKHTSRKQSLRMSVVQRDKSDQPDNVLRVCGETTQGGIKG